MVTAAALLLIAALPGSARLEPRSITVLEVGVPDPPGVANPAARCRPFRPTAAQVLMWFRTAKRISAAAEVEADFSQCLARGTLHANDGRSYRWELDQAGVGVIIIKGADSLYFQGRALPFKISL